MNNTKHPSVIPDARVLIEAWERAAAGIKDDALAPAHGVLAGLAIGLPLDIALIVWVLGCGS